MKNKALLSISGILIVFVIVGIWVNNVRATKPSEGDPSITLKVNAEKESYVLGEVVRLSFELINEGDNPITLPYRPSVSTGYLSVWIALDGSKFNQYNNSTWGRFEGSGVTIQPARTIRSEATILWNNRPQTSHLNASAEELAKKDKIVTDYAFPVSGIYYIRAIVSIPDKDSADTMTQIVSKPFQINVTQPVGEDLKVWERIKGNGDVAYFVQQGGTPTYKDEKAENLLKEIEGITQEHPNSFLAMQMKQKLEKFRIDDARRTELSEKTKIKPNN